MSKTTLRFLETMDALLLRPASVAVILGISRAFTYELIAAGQIPSVRLGKAVRVPRAAFVNWLRDNKCLPLARPHQLRKSRREARGMSAGMKGRSGHQPFRN
jgi:excisionase family DNA binding protein